MVSLFVLTLVSASTARASAGSCPNERLRQESNLDPVTREPVSAKLPDCRAYEMVSPPFKNGQNPTSLEISFLDPSHLIFSDNGAFGGALQDWVLGADYLGTRGASGWGALPLDPPAGTLLGSGGGPLNGVSPVQDVSQDFETSLFGIARSSLVDLHIELRRPAGPGGSCPAGAVPVPGSACLVEVGPVFPPAAVEAWKPGEPAPEKLFQYVDASRDLSSRLIFKFSVTSEFKRFLWPGDTTIQNESLYEYAGTGNSEPKLVAVENAGPLLSNAEAKPISQCGIFLGGDSSNDTYNAVSASGEKVFFTARQGGCENEGKTGAGPPVNELYARVDGSSTVDLSEPSTGPTGDCELCNTSSPAEGVFQGASEDGSKVFFLNKQANLLPGAEGMNLYEYDFNGPAHNKLLRISDGVANPEVQGVARVSETGSHVYFVAKAVLASNEDAKKETAQAGQNNLYVYEPDPEHAGQYRTVFIAALSEFEDSEVWSTQDLRPVEATPDGRFLLFSSVNDLTPDASGEGRELYRYDAQTGSLVRVSIGQQAPGGYFCPETGKVEPGFNCNGHVNAFFGAVFHAYSGVNTYAGEKGVSISDDGAYVFFSGKAGLTPQALNRQCIREESGECIEKASNIYEYHDGQVYLISDGQDRHSVLGGSTVVLEGATHSGSDVFFTTADQLVGQDTDTQSDIYDARIGGGFPAPATPAPCQDEAQCAGAPSSAPLFGAPSSSTFSGAGNVPPPAATQAVKPKPKALTRVQLLRRALRACGRKPKRKRKACVRGAHRRYSAGSTATHHHISTHASGRSR
jgi:hypothetical protein